MEDTLAELHVVAKDLGATELVMDAEALVRKREEGAFFVVCLGQAKRGKSTLLNAFLRRAVLPVGLLPVTSVVTILKYGEPSVLARFRDGRCLAVALDELPALVSEQGNPGNAKGVSLVEVRDLHPLLASGLCLVDTPGIASIHGPNTEETRRFIPHLDAALLILGGDPPITADELDLARDAAFSTPEIAVVLNKADLFTPPMKEELRAFTARALEPIEGRPRITPIWVSAKERLEGGDGGPEWPELEAQLSQWAARGPQHLAPAGLAKGVARLAARLKAEILRRKKDLLAPASEAEARMDRLRTALDEASLARRALSYRLQAEMDGISSAFRICREERLAEVLPRCREALASATWSGRSGAVAAAQALSATFNRELMAKLDQEWQTGLAEAEHRAEVVIRAFCVPVKEDLGIEMEAVFDHADEPAKVRSRYYEMAFRELAPISWKHRLMDGFRPAKAFRKAVLRDVTAYLVDMLGRNSQRLENDLNDQLADRRRALDERLRAALARVLQASQRSFERAIAARSKGQDQASVAVATLAALEARLDSAGGGLTSSVLKDGTGSGTL